MKEEKHVATNLRMLALLASANYCILKKVDSTSDSIFKLF